MKARLFCKTGQLAGVAREFSAEATIGKESQNSIQLDAAPVSGKHARIFFDTKAGCYMLEDLGSRNGTRVDGARVKEKEKLGNLHVITFAEKFDFIFQVMADAPAGVSPGPGPVMEDTRKAAAEPSKQGKEGTPVVADPGSGRAAVAKTVFDDAPIIAPPVPKPESPATVLEDAPIVVPAGPRPKQPSPDSSAPSAQFELEVSVGPTAAFPLQEGDNIVGREISCSIRIEDNSLSRQHAVITVKSGKVTLKDLMSKNSTFVGGARIKDEVEIVPGADLRFGLVQARLRRKL